MAFVYMLRCSDGSLYTGFTLNLRRRVAQHNAGQGAKYTRAHRPVRLIWAAELPEERLARRAEVLIKQLDTPRKRRLAAGELSLWEVCPRIWQEDGEGAKKIGLTARKKPKKAGKKRRKRKGKAKRAAPRQAKSE